MPYVNTLVTFIHRYLTEILGITANLLIYDNRTTFYNVYNPLLRVTGKTYSQHRDVLLSTQNKKAVVAEPLPNLIQDTVSYINPLTNEVIDTLIIYDRMKNVKDIVRGNNVYKFFVMNSEYELNALTGSLHINKTNQIITRPDSAFAKDVIDIPYIENFKSVGEDAKLSKYLSLASKHTGEKIILNICKIAGIDMSSIR